MSEQSESKRFLGEEQFRPLSLPRMSAPAEKKEMPQLPAHRLITLMTMKEVLPTTRAR
jgi:hypothetical protein